jgi:hypothetical protein
VLALLSCTTFAVGIGGSLIPEWSADAPRSLFDVGAEPTARTPVAAGETRLDGWSLDARDETPSWGVVDVIGCSESQIYYALASLPVVTERFAALAPRDGFLSVIHVDYGSVSVAGDRLFPIRHPGSECFGQSASAFPSMEHLAVEPIDEVDVVAYRLGPGESVRAVVADDTGRAAIITGARATDFEVRTLVGQLAAQLQSGTD